MTKLLKSLSINIAGTELVEKDGELLVPLQTVSCEDTNLYILSDDGGKFDQPLSDGSFSILGDVESSDIYFVKTVQEALVINRAINAAAIVYYESSNCKHVVKSLYDYGCPSKSIVVIDRDESASDESDILKSKEISSLISIFKHKEHKNYFSMAAALGYTEVTNSLYSIIKEAEKKKGKRISFQRVTELGPLKGVDWLVDEMVQENGFINVFGPSGHYKSFAVLEMACCIAAGIKFHGLETNKKAVLYICGEGEDGINARIQAWQTENNHTGPLDVFMTSDPVRLLNDGDYDLLISTIKEMIAEIGIEVGLVVMDTLNRCFGGGDENNTKDMTMFSDACIDLKREIGTSVLVVHHTSDSNPRKAKGNNALKGNLESEINVLRPADESGEFYGYVEMRVTKQKNGKEIEPLFFIPEIVNVGKDPKGKDVTSVLLKSGPGVINFVNNCKEKEANEIKTKGARKTPIKKTVGNKEAIMTTGSICERIISMLDQRSFVSKSEIVSMINDNELMHENGKKAIEYILKNNIAEFTSSDMLTMKK